MILRDRLIQRLRQICQVEIRLLLVHSSRRTLYTAPNGGIRTQGPACMMVVGLETVQDLVMMLTSANQVREEFGMWIDDKIYKQLMQVAADLESWATTRNLAIATAELIYFWQQIIVQLLNNYLKINLSIGAEIKSAWESWIYGEFQKSDVAWVTV